MGRAFGFLTTVIVMAVGWYIYSMQLQTATAVGGEASPTGVANITGVQNDLISIANAERGYLASQGKYASFEELIAGRYLTIERERPPYTYDVETTSSGFHATATRTSAGRPAQLWIDETMRVQSSD